MATFVILFAVAGFSLFNYELTYLERGMALALTTLLIVAASLVFLVVKVVR